METDEIKKGGKSFIAKVVDDKKLNIKENVDIKSFSSLNLIQHKDITLWQRSYLSGEVLDKQLAYWKERLSGFERLEFPLDKSRPNQVEYRGDNVDFEIDSKEANILRKLAREEKVTLYTILLSIFNILLFKYTSQNDIVIGTPVANRHYSQLENLIGFFVNSLAIRTKIDSEQKLKDLIAQIHDNLVGAQTHQDLPFEKLVDELKVEKDTGRHPIFQIMFGIQNFGKIEEKNSFYKPYSVQQQYPIAKFDLSLFVSDLQEKMCCSFNYATSLFHKETIQRLAKHYKYLLYQIAECYQNTALDLLKVADLQILTPEEYQEIVYDWNKTDAPYPKEKTIYQLFEEQVERTPDNIAVVFEDKELTYRELNKKSNQLARYIREQYKKQTGEELKPDTFIALCLDRSFEMITTILGILKAGGAYVPIDPSYPNDRISFILGDTNAKIVITQKYLQRQLKDIVGNEKKNQLLCIDDNDIKKQLEKLSVDNLKPVSQSTDLAYVIYTSGTTGKPKGVMVNYNSISNLIMEQVRSFGLNVNVTKHCLQFASMVFDASVSEIFSALLYGHILHIVSEEQKTDIQKLSELFETVKIQVATLPPALLKNFNVVFKNLETLIVAGESPEKQVLDKYFNSGAKVINAYGPTEATVCASLNIYNKNGAHNIGKPLCNSRIYILSSEMYPVPIGVIGELHIGGIGLARGYLKRPELTAERFIPNPFATEEDKVKGYTRLYKTGDLCRWLSDGNIEFIGRTDFQVKIRGFRIELGEIENVILQLDGIKQVVVLTKENQTEFGSNKYLVAYYTKKTEDGKLKTVDKGILRTHLSKTLPEYMVPSAFVEMENFPLTVNGKLDRKALPDPEFTDKENYVAPTNELEHQLCNIWQEVLGIKRVGITDDFLRLGGNSILAIRLAHKMGSTLGKYISVATILQQKTIANIFHDAFEKELLDIYRIAKINPKLSFAQERLWFIELYEQGTNAYNIPISLQLDIKVDIDAIQKSLKSIVQRHEVLRTIFKQDDKTGEYYQCVLDVNLEVTQSSYTTREDLNRQLIKDTNHIFKLDQEFPIKVWIYIYKLTSADKKHAHHESSYLLINIHHIVFDDWSMDILFKELNSYYSYYTQNVHLDLPELTIQYKDFALWQRSYLSGEILDKQLTYWREQLSGFETLEFPLDKPRPSQVMYDGDNICFDIESKQANILRKIARDKKVTLYTTLLSIFNILLFKYTNQNDIVIGIPVANRHYPQLENLIGFFVNSLAIRTKIDSQQKLKDLIAQIHDNLIGAQTHQDLPFEKLVDELKVEKDTSRHPIFQIMLVQEGEVQQTKSPLYKFYSVAGQHLVAKFDLSLFINETSETMHCVLNYATSLFHKETIQRLAKHYKYLLYQIAECYQNKNFDLLKVKDLQMLTPGEYQEIVYDWNKTDVLYPNEKTIYQLFEEQVEKTPENIAVRCEGEKLSYTELNEQANKLAQKLANCGVIHERLVAIYENRDIKYLVSILGVFKAGGAYLPLDTMHPADRICQILNQSGATIAIVTRDMVAEFQEKLDDLNVKIELLIIEDILEQPTKVSSLPIPSKVYNLAYVIYTSGSTGLPKGAMLEQVGMINHLYAKIRELELTEQDVVAQTASQCFDISVWQFLSSLLVGGCTEILKNDTANDPVNLIDAVEKCAISVLEVVPSMLGMMIEELNQRGHNKPTLSRLRWLIPTGEALSPVLCREWFKCYETIPLLNAYGPTECSDDVTHYQIRSSPNENILSIPIGRPLGNMRIYILDPYMQLVPQGIIGELYVSGIGVGRGYLNDSERTQKVFLDNPFANEEDRAKGYARLYKTGDLAKWLPDGNIEFIGRNDFQVKIRGFRIELGEIENAILQVEGIKQVVVLTKEKQTESGSNKYLVAYYSKKIEDLGQNTVEEKELREHLEKILPEYMVPSAFVEMEEFPLTVNGKLDRKALPDPEFTSKESYVAPTSELEQQLCTIWREVLGIERVGVTDDFFRIGGNSILAIRVMFRINNKLQLDIKIGELFFYRNIKSLAKQLIFSASGEEVEV